MLFSSKKAFPMSMLILIIIFYYGKDCKRLFSAFSPNYQQLWILGEVLLSHTRHIVNRNCWKSLLPCCPALPYTLWKCLGGVSPSFPALPPPLVDNCLVLVAGTSCLQGYGAQLSGVTPAFAILPMVGKIMAALRCPYATPQKLQIFRLHRKWDMELKLEVW